jgi:hypothetical protein
MLFQRWRSRVVDRLARGNRPKMPAFPARALAGAVAGLALSSDEREVQGGTRSSPTTHSQSSRSSSQRLRSCSSIHRGHLGEPRPRRCICLEAALRTETSTGPSASSRPPRGLCATRPPWRFVACLPADLTEVGQCVSPSPGSPSVLPEATTKLVRHARPPSLPSQPTPVVIACPREEAEHTRGVRGGPSHVTNGLLLSPGSNRDDPGASTAPASKRQRG